MRGSRTLRIPNQRERGRAVGAKRILRRNARLIGDGMLPMQTRRMSVAAAIARLTLRNGAKLVVTGI